MGLVFLLEGTEKSCSVMRNDVYVRIQQESICLQTRKRTFIRNELAGTLIPELKAETSLCSWCLEQCQAHRRPSLVTCCMSTVNDVAYDSLMLGGPPSFCPILLETYSPQ